MVRLNNLTFEQYMDKEIPSWKTTLDMQSIESLKQIYDGIIYYENKYKNIVDLSNQFRDSGIDYSGDLIKANMEAEALEKKLEYEISAINAVINGYDKEFYQNEREKANTTIIR